MKGSPARPRNDARLFATFLMRSIFCEVAQNVGLLPEHRSFSDLLICCQTNLPAFVGLLGVQGRRIDAGGSSAALAAMAHRFNGRCSGQVCMVGPTR